MSIICLFLFVLLPLQCAFAGPLDTITRDIEYLEGDLKAFYLETGTLALLGAGVAGAGSIANTSVDSDFHRYYSGRLRGNTTDDVAGVFEKEALIAVPVIAGAHLFYSDAPDSFAGRTLRAMATGAPAVLFLQYSTGGGRPIEGDSEWRPFKNNNGVSNHAFLGAVPFLTAAMGADSTREKALFYGLSALPGLSRINDGKHYLSQVALGWHIAYLSAAAVSGRDASGSVFFILPRTGGAVMGVSLKF